MKKTLLLFCAAFGLAQTMFGLTIEEGKYYTVRNFSSNSVAYMADTEATDNRVECVATLSGATYWQFVSTGNANCYYVKNYATGRYIQGYSGSEEKVLMGDNPVEYQVQAFDNEGGRFGFSVTSKSPHDFTGGTLGLNLHAESNKADCYAQSFAAVAGTNHRSFWTLELVTPPMIISTSKVYTMSNGTDNNVYIKDNGGDELAMGDLDNTSLWQFEDAGNGQFYVKNVKTGRYAQACAADTEVSVTMGDAPVAYVLVNCSDQEGKDCFGLTSADQTNTAFTDGCVGWNWRGDNIVQTFAAKAGTNHRSFWKFTEFEPQAIASGYASYGNTTEDVIILGAQAYKGTAGTSWLSLSEVSDVPANKGVIIKGSLYAVASTTASADMTGNSLLVSDGTVTSDGTNYYALSTLKGTAEVGFYPVGNGVTIPAGKAYLNLSVSLVKGFTFVFEDETPTAIAEIENENLKVESPIFNLAGQRLQKMQKGINIINGKKVLY